MLDDETCRTCGEVHDSISWPSPPPPTTLPPAKLGVPRSFRREPPNVFIVVEARAPSGVVLAVSQARGDRKGVDADDRGEGRG